MPDWIEGYLSTARQVARDADALANELGHVPSSIAVNVHSYAWPAHAAFVRRYYADGKSRIAALSMNPARNGAVQTGIAFTDAPTARRILPDFDGLVARPQNLATERAEMSGQKLQMWAKRDLGGLTQLYGCALFPIACPVAVLKGPQLLNVPLANLPSRFRRAADAFHEEHAALLVRAINPTGVLVLGSYAADRWRRVARDNGDLASLPAVATHHPAARMPNGKKFNDWSRAVGLLSAPRGSPTSAAGARR